VTSVGGDGTFGVLYEDGDEEEAVPLEELFHELQARFAEISRDSPRFAIRRDSPPTAPGSSSLEGGEEEEEGEEYGLKLL